MHTDRLLGSPVSPTHPSLSVTGVETPVSTSTSIFPQLLPCSCILSSVSLWSVLTRQVASGSQGWCSHYRGSSIPLCIFLSHLLLRLKSWKYWECDSPQIQPSLCVPGRPPQICALDRLGFVVEREQFSVQVAPETLPLVSIKAFISFEVLVALPLPTLWTATRCFVWALCLPTDLVTNVS